MFLGDSCKREVRRVVKYCEFNLFLLRNGGIIHILIFLLLLKISIQKIMKIIKNNDQPNTTSKFVKRKQIDMTKDELNKNSK